MVDLSHTGSSLNGAKNGANVAVMCHSQEHRQTLRQVHSRSHGRDMTARSLVQPHDESLCKLSKPPLGADTATTRFYLFADNVAAKRRVNYIARKVEQCGSHKHRAGLEWSMKAAKQSVTRNSGVVACTCHHVTKQTG
jgi:hypothetical protein